MAWFSRLRSLFGSGGQPPVHEAAGRGRRSMAWMPGNPGAVAALLATHSDLRSKSRDLLDETRTRYDQLIAKMAAAEATMPPVLAAFKDHVLFLKHNLNAQAIASLRDTVVEIEDDVERLLGEMQASIDEADAFIAAMST